MKDFLLHFSMFHCADGVVMTSLNENGIRIDAPAAGGGVYTETSLPSGSGWSHYGYMTADVYHESHDVLVVLISFTDEAGRTITIHYGILPLVRTTICLPLAALNGEKLFLDRYPGVMQSVLRGDAFVDRSRIRTFSISTIESVAARSFELSMLKLCSEEPVFQYEAFPYIDELGQLTVKEWEGKIKNEEDLVRELKTEWTRDREAGHTRYGGWEGLRFASSGYFRTEFDDDRWWFVDPDGYALFSTGMDCIHPAEATRLSGMEHLLPQPFEPEERFRDAWLHRGYSFGIANLIRAFGGEWREKWMDLTEERLKAWGINTIGNWSSPDFIRNSQLPYVYPMHGYPETKHNIFRDFPDVFSPEYSDQAAVFADQLHALREDRRLIGYFMRNEPHWAFVDGLDLTEQMLRSPVQFVSKTRFVHWLRDKYGTVDCLNEAWGASFTEFEDATENPVWLDASGDTPARKDDFTAFNRLMIRRYVEIPARHCKAVDPHHLNLGMRYAWVGSSDVLEGCEAFDVFSINCYQMEPPTEMIRDISKRLNQPVMIGEFHFGAADAGLQAYGIRALENQTDRAQAYRYFVERAAVMPELIGVHYFQLNDQPALGRFDGENYQIGVVDVCQKPYRRFTEAMKETHDHMYDIRIGKLEPTTICPYEIPKTGF